MLWDLTPLRPVALSASRQIQLLGVRIQKYGVLDAQRNIELANHQSFYDLTSGQAGRDSAYRLLVLRH
jgi:hypothetical protein